MFPVVSPHRSWGMMRWGALVVAACFTVLGSAAAQTTVSPMTDLTLGMSTQGRSINVLRVGDGPRKLVLVGAVHGGPERNTFVLVTELAAHFRANPGAVPPDVSLYIMPTLNPDGLELDIRQNANGIDLNRNMDTSADSCPENDWSQQVAGAYGIISNTGGAYSESEVESRLIRDFLLDAHGVIFFHTSGGVVFPACDHAPSNMLARVFGEGAGYAFIPKWDLYAITGGMHDWAGGLGIAAITPELITADQPETEQNLAGVMAIMNRADEVLPEPQPHTEGMWNVQPVIWRAWKAWGGARLFGLPLGPAVQIGTSWTQVFERAVLTYRPDQSDTAAVVQLDALGRDLLGARVVATEPPSDDARFFPETQHTLRGLFADFWQINGGLPLFGLPLTGEEFTTDARGQPAIRQVFERVVLERPREATGPAEITLVPLGRLRWAQRDARSPRSGVRPR